jgi:hypothetical protein
VKARIAITKDITRRNNLGDLLHDIGQMELSVIEQSRERTARLRDERIALEREAAERRRIARDARQFVALGLTREGEEQAPGLRALQQQRNRIAEAISGTPLARKFRQTLLGIRRVLSGELGKVGRDMRLKVRQMLDDIDDEFKRRSGDVVRFRQINAKRFIAMLGLDLTLAQTRRLKAALSQLGPGMTIPNQSLAFAGAGGIQVGTVNVYGVQDAARFEAELTRRANRRAKVRRGAR